MNKTIELYEKLLEEMNDCIVSIENNDQNHQSNEIITKLNESIDLIQNKLYILNESIIPITRTKFKHSIWIDDAGTNRNIPLNEARIKVSVKTKFGERLYPIVITNTDIMIIANDNKVKREIEKDKKLMEFIKNNRELFILHYSMKYNHIFNTTKFVNTLIKYINDDLHSKREVIDYLFKGHEKEKPII